MVDDNTLAQVVPEIYTRLTMMAEEWNYEIRVPGTRGFLMLTGGENLYEFTITPVRVSEDGHRAEGFPRTFPATGEGLCDWLRSEPWDILYLGEPYKLSPGE
jgi:hypothetical protein